MKVRVYATGDRERYRRYVGGRTERHSVMFQVNTASDISIISKETWKKVGSPKLQETQVKALNVSGERMKFRSKFPCQYGKRI